ncbi:hypothetical protein SMICM304S_08822 [Streptomyces microflavus]
MEHGRVQRDHQQAEAEDDEDDPAVGAVGGSRSRCRGRPGNLPILPMGSSRSVDRRGCGVRVSGGIDGRASRQRTRVRPGDTWPTSYAGPPHRWRTTGPRLPGGRRRRGGTGAPPPTARSIPADSCVRITRKIKHASERNPGEIGRKITQILICKSHRSETKSTSHRHHKAAGSWPAQYSIAVASIGCVPTLLAWTGSRNRRDSGMADQPSPHRPLRRLLAFHLAIVFAVLVTSWLVTLHWKVMLFRPYQQWPELHAFLDYYVVLGQRGPTAVMVACWLGWRSWRQHTLPGSALVRPRHLPAAAQCDGGRGQAGLGRLGPHYATQIGSAEMFAGGEISRTHRERRGRDLGNPRLSGHHAPGQGALLRRRSPPRSRWASASPPSTSARMAQRCGAGLGGGAAIRWRCPGSSR